jgi:hypothetical protein
MILASTPMTPIHPFTSRQFAPLEKFILEIIGPYGLSFAVMYIGPDTGERKVCTNFQEDWCKEYAENSFFFIDPVLRYIRSRFRFFWSNLKKEIVLSEKEKKLFEAAGQAGLKSGYSQILDLPNGALCVLTFAADLDDDDFIRLYNKLKPKLDYIAKKAAQHIAQLIKSEQH